MRKLILTTIVAAFICLCSAVESPKAMAKTVVDSMFVGTCELCDGIEGIYLFVTINGEKGTIFIGDDGIERTGDGHGTFGVPDGDDTPIATANVGLEFQAQTGSLFVETDEEVRVIVFDVQTLSVVANMTVASGTANISLANYPAGCRYTAVAIQGAAEAAKLSFCK